jgi:hypothetical protein
MASADQDQDGSYQLIWYIKDRKLQIGKYKTGNYQAKKVESLSTADIGSGDLIRMHYSKKAAALTTDLTGSPEIPKQFHEGICSRVLEKLSARGKDFIAARYYRAEWQDCLRRGKQYTNKMLDGTSYTVAQHEM